MTKPLSHRPIEERKKLYDKAMKLREEKGWGGMRIAREVPVNRKTIDHWIYGDRKPFSGGNGRLKLPNLKPNKELSYVLGVFYGDGCAYKNTIEEDGCKTFRCFVDLKVTDEDFAEEFSRCLAHVIGREEVYSVSRMENGRCKQGYYFRVNTCNRALYEFLKKPLENHKSIIEEYPFNFLRGFYDSDGSVYTYEMENNVWNQRVTISNSDYELMAFVRDLLYRHLSIPKHKIGIVHKKGQKAPHGTATKDCYQMMFSRHEDISSFYKKVGFSIYRKQKVLREMAQRKTRS